MVRPNGVLKPTPKVSGAHWLLRLPLGAIIIQQGYIKFPLSADEAASYDLPLLLWSVAALGELVAGCALIVGGLIWHWFGDVITRLAGLAIALIVTGVLVVAY